MSNAAAVFNAANLVATQKIQNGIDAGVEDFRRRLRVFLTNWSRNFFPTVVLPAIGKEQAPFYAPAWARLSPDYAFSKGPRSQFWENSSFLRTHVAGMDATRVFGSPRVDVGISGVESLRAGFRSEGTRIRELSTGRFASRSTAFDGVVASLTMTVFPGAQGLSGSALFGKMFGSNPMLETRAAVTEFGRTSMLQMRINHPARPLFLPAIQYAQTTLLRAGLKQQFGIDV